MGFLGFKYFLWDFWGLKAWVYTKWSLGSVMIKAAHLMWLNSIDNFRDLAPLLWLVDVCPPLSVAAEVCERRQFPVLV